jgi:MFS family permease
MSATLPVTAWTIAAACLTGLLLALLGSLKLAMARRPERISGPLTLLLVLLNVVLLPLLLLSGWLIDVWGLRPMMIVGPVLLALALLTLSARPSFYPTMIAIAAAAMATTSVATTSAVLMPRALFGESERVSSFLLGMVFVALGALVSAPLVELLRRGMGFRRAMAVLALVSLLPAFLVALPMENVGVVERPGGIVQLVQDDAVWLGALVLFFYAPLEGFVSVWVTKHLEVLGESPRQATNLLIGFWGAMIVSRLVMALIQHSTGLRDHYASWFMIVPALLVAVVLGNLAAMPRVGGIRVGLVLLGAFMGPIYPLVIGLVFRKLAVPLPDGVMDQTGNPGMAYALLCAGGSVGGFLLAPLVGFCARARSQPIALLIPMFVALLLTAAAVVFSLQRAG